MPLPVLVNLNQSVNLHSCDQCNQRRRRCDRKTPSCSQCTFREVSCSYNRQLKRCQVLARDSISLSPALSPPSNHSSSSTNKPDGNLVIIPFDNPLVNQPRRKSNSKIIKNSREKFDSVLQWGDPAIDGCRTLNVITVHKLASTWPYTMSGFIDFLRGGPSARFPPIYVAKPCLAPCLPVSTVWAGLNIKVQVFCLATIPFKSNYSYELCRILDRALVNYFEVVNPFNPLFIYQLFNKCPRSEKLMVAIWLSGIHHLQSKSEADIYVKEILFKRLKELIKLSSLTASFETLQFILVILVGMRGFLGIESTVRQCQNLMIRLTHGLGVHVDIPQGKIKSNVLALERKLAYHLAASTDSTRGWGLQLPYLRTVDHCYPQDSSYSLMIRFQDIIGKIAMSRDKNSLRGLGWDLGSIHYSCFLFENVYPIFNLHCLHFRLTQGLTTVSEVKATVASTQNDTLEVSRNLLSRLYGIQSQYDLSGEADSSTECYVNGSLMFTRVLCYANASLVTMAESDPRLGNREPTDTIISASTQVVLDWAFQVIAASLQLPHHLPLFEGRVFLSTTVLSFIIRHIKLHPNTTHAYNTIRAGYSHLKSLMRHTGLSLHVQENLQILDQLCKDCNLTHIIKPTPILNIK